MKVHVCVGIRCLVLLLFLLLLVLLLLHLLVLGTWQASLGVEVSLPLVLVLGEVGDQLVHNVLHRPVKGDVVERVGLVNHNLALK